MVIGEGSQRRVGGESLDVFLGLRKEVVGGDDFERKKEKVLGYIS